MTARRAIVLGDGDAPTRAGLDAAWPSWAAGVDLVVAADGGARLAAGLGLHLDAWVGDGDSIGPAALEELREAGVRISHFPADKDESDAEIALITALAAGATDVTILGALGGLRLDHELANLALLGHPAAAGVDLRLLDDRARVRLLVAPGPDGRPARLDLAGRIGDLVSLLPLDDAIGVTTAGLRFPLRDEALPAGRARGLSNVRDAAAAEVSLRRGRIMVVEVPATLPE